MTRILIVRIGALGDAIHSLPMLNELRRGAPEGTIDWLAGPGVARFLEGHPALDNLVIVKRSAAGYWDAVKRIRGRYDISIDAQGLIKSAVFARAAARRVIGRSAGHAKERPACWLYTETVAPKREHIIEQNMELLEPLALPGFDPSRLEYNLALPTPPAWPLLDKRPILLNIGGGWRTKLWPREHFAALSRTINEETGVAVGIVWGPGEKGDADWIARNSPAEVAPATNFKELAALFTKASLMVSGETGPLHLAVAVGCPSIGLLGPTHKERNGALGREHINIEPEIGCRPCWSRTCADFRCMEQITVERVFEAVKEIQRRGARFSS